MLDKYQPLRGTGYLLRLQLDLLTATGLPLLPVSVRVSTFGDGSAFVLDLHVGLSSAVVSPEQGSRDKACAHNRVPAIQTRSQHTPGTRLSSLGSTIPIPSSASPGMNTRPASPSMVLNLGAFLAPPSSLRCLYNLAGYWHLCRTRKQLPRQNCLRN